MVTRILIIGGYGNFGSFIVQILACEENIQLLTNRGLTTIRAVLQLCRQLIYDPH
jgi:hypothetical protein